MLRKQYDFLATTDFPQSVRHQRSIQEEQPLRGLKSPLDKLASDHRRANVVVGYGGDLTNAEIRRGTESLAAVAGRLPGGTSLTIFTATGVVYRGAFPRTSDELFGLVVPWARRVSEHPSIDADLLLRGIADEVDANRMSTAVIMVSRFDLKTFCEDRFLTLMRAGRDLRRNEFVESVTIVGPEPHRMKWVDLTLAGLLGSKLRVCGFRSSLVAEIVGELGRGTQTLPDAASQGGPL